MQPHRFTILAIFLLFISTALISCEERLLFEEKDAATTGISFTNTVRESDSFNLLTYPYFFNGAGVAVGDINNDGWEDIFFTGNTKGANKLYLNKKDFRFADITTSAGMQGKSDWCTGVSMTDINADGWLDIYVCTVSIPGHLQGANELYINNRNGTFTESAATYGLDFKGHGTQAAFFDYDNDGDLDCFLLNHADTYTEGYKEVAARSITDPFSGDRLLQNNNGKFTDVTGSAGIYSSAIGYGLGIAVGDINNDGWQDIYVSNDFKENDYCYINNGNGTFTENCNELFGHTSRFSMGNDMADYNNDGWLDLVSLDMLSPDEKILKSSVSDDDIGVYDYKHNFGFQYQFSKNCLQQSVDGQYFQELGLQKGIAATDWSWAPLFADFNNDGKKDLFVSNGFKYRLNDLDFNAFVQGEHIQQQQQNVLANKLDLLKKIPGGQVPDYFYLQDAAGDFTDASAAAGFTTPALSNGAVYADLDKDGRLDLVINRLEAPAAVYRNLMPLQNFINIQLKGEGGNTLGIGTSVYVYANNELQRYHQSLSRGFMSSTSPVIHIGLGGASVIDSMMVVWPDGRVQSLIGIRANTTLVLAQKDAAMAPRNPVLKQSIDTGWKNITAKAGISFIHKEDEFEDLNVQPLLPHSIATQGPKTATADVNKDGLQDFYICGAKGQAGQLYLQTVQSQFIAAVQTCFANDSMYEDTDALFFDADGDTDMDLYVASGGNEYFGSNALLKDRLYINDGKGSFTNGKGLPALYENKSCVAAADFDKDGDLDLFVGGRVNARMYGYLPASVLLQNNGRGNFTEVTGTVSTALQYAGMVTGACWSDVDKDGWPDLVVAGEWMPILVFKNEQGKLAKMNQPGLIKTNGWWNCIAKQDLDGDGDDDFLVGNWGSNTKMIANADHPLLMYLADWDGNQDIDPLLCMYKGDAYYNFLGKADLEKRLPYLKKKYLKYSDIAGRSVEELFGKSAIGAAKKLEAFTLLSAVIWNNQGQLSLQPLPAFLQVAPIFSFASFTNKAGRKSFIAAGNFSDVLPYEGRYDAMLPTMFSFTNTIISSASYLLEKGAIRSIQAIGLAGNKSALLLSRNNGALSLVKQ